MVFVRRPKWSTHPFILQPRFLQFLEIRFQKYGLRNLVQEIWFEKSGWPEKKVVLYHKSTRNLVHEKWLARKKNWVCRTTVLKSLFYTFLEKWLQNKWSNGFAFKMESVTKMTVKSGPEKFILKFLHAGR